MCASHWPDRYRLRFVWLALGFVALGSPAARGQDGADAVTDRDTTPPRRIVLRLTGEAFAPLIDREVDETTPVNDVILGTPVRGRSRTVGVPKLALVDDDKAAAFVLTLSGTTVSKTVGHNGPAVIHSRSETYYTASKRVVFKAGEGFVAEPAKINARTRIITEGIGSTRRGFIGRSVVRRAAPQIDASRPAAEEVVRQKAMRRISATFDRFLEGRLVRLNRAADMREMVALVLRGETEPRYAFCTKDGCMQITASFGNNATVIQLPEMDEKAAPVQIWIHESLVGERIASIARQFDETRRGANLLGRAIEVVPAVINPEAQKAEVSEQPGPPPAFVVVDDWFVVQFGTQPPASDPSRVAKQPRERVQLR